MFKKLFILVFLGLALGIYFWPEDDSFAAFDKENCPFCNPSILKKQTFYEDDLVIALCTHKPIVPGHCLIIPKRHVERFELLSDAEGTQICQVVKKVNTIVSKAFGTSSYLLLQKNGREVGQSVPHIHVHYIPRKAGDCSFIKFFIKIIFENFKSPISSEEMAETVAKLNNVSL